MENTTVVIAGASGFIGTYFFRRFAEDGWNVRTIGRAPYASATWGDDAGLTAALDGADLLVNLAGRTVNCRYNRRNRAEILDSRVSTTAALGTALSRCSAPPATWLNASTGTIYRDARDRPQTEDDGELGGGFSVDVARAWEAALAEAPASATRKVALRIAIVLGPGGGVMRPFANLARLGLGGPMGAGTQKFSWIHIEDLYQAVRFLHEHAGISGPVNIAAPEAVSNRELMRLVRGVYRAPVGVPTPGWLLKLGAIMIGTEAELVLKSRWVEPRGLLDAGFTFSEPRLGPALERISRARR